MSFVRSVSLALVGLGCGRDVMLGTDFDAAVDTRPSNNPFAAGGYTLHVSSPGEVQCMGSLSGNESSFTSLAPADLSFVDGAVTLATISDTSLAISGVPIMSGWNQSTITLAPDLNEPTLWQAQVDGDFGSGPLGTVRGAVAFAALSETGMNASIEAAVAVLFVTTDTNGTCDLVFASALAKL